MVVSIVFNKIKHLVLFVINLIRRALCCFRRRPRNSFDDESVPLTHIGIVSDSLASKTTNKEEWEQDWGVVAHNKPKTVQDHINLYRQQRQTSEEETPQLNFFEDMTPKITRQTKVVLNSENETGPQRRFDFVPNSTDVVGDELREWEETSGWEGETLDWDAQEALRQKKRQEMERKITEQHQKRQEKLNKSLGARIST